MTTDTDTVERLAAIEHTQWAHWTEHMLENLTPENIERWRRQISTPYSNLSEREKESDRKWARRAIAALPPVTPAEIAQAKKVGANSAYFLLSKHLAQGAELIQQEREGLAGGITVNGKLSHDPDDAHTLNQIEEMDRWLRLTSGILATADRLTASDKGDG
jgi:hypothetical protein